MNVGIHSPPSPRLNKHPLLQQMLLGFAACAAGLSTLAQTAEPRVSVEPRLIPLEAPELVNPMRGYFRWINNEMIPQPKPATEAYLRINWRKVEPARDQYDFSAIEQGAEQAKAEGRRFAFRLRCVVENTRNQCPDYIEQEVKKGFWFNGRAKVGPRTENANTYVPDWNDPLFLERVDKLLAAVGQRYDGDPRIAFVDIGIYGNFGEWHCYGFPYPNPSGAEAASPETMRRIVDAHVQAFKKTRLVMMSDSKVLDYALGLSERIGWRRDSYGWSHFDDIRKNPGWALAKDRWKTAPIVAEVAHTDGTHSLDQVLNYHIAMIGNGNFGKLAGNPKLMAEFAQAGKLAGYRFEVRKVSLPAILKPGGHTTIDSRWANVGLTPAYEPWVAFWQLRDATGRIACQVRSKLDPEKLLVGEAAQSPPSGINSQTPSAQGQLAHPPPSFRDLCDSLELPAGLSAGRYDLCLIVTLPGSYLPPMQLAIEGRRDDGSYKLASVVVK